jgi:endonuclease III
MSVKSTKQEQKEEKYSNTIYVSERARKKLEELVTEIGYEKRKIMSASSFVRYLIENFGEDAKKKLLNNE